MTIDPLRIGLVGASRIAVPAIIEPTRTLSGLEVTAVAARDPARAERYAEEHGIPRAHASYDALMNDPDIDLVYISTTPDAHAEQALAAISAGKAALVEKPFSLDAREAADVAAAAAAADVPVFEAMHSLHHPLFARVLAIIAAGTLGRVQSLDARFNIAAGLPDENFRWDVRRGGGALMDLGVYPLAWCRNIAGEDFEVLSASAEMRRGVDGRAEAVLQFAHGPRATIECSMVAEAFLARLVVRGTGGEMTVKNPVAPQNGHSITLETEGGPQTETVEGPSSYAAQLSAVGAAVRRSAPFPLQPNDYVHSMAAIDKIASVVRA